MEKTLNVGFQMTTSYVWFLSLEVLASNWLWGLLKTEVVDVSCFREGKHQQV